MNRRGEITILTLAAVAVVCGLLGSVFSSGVNTRSNVSRANVSIRGDSNTVVVVFDGQRVEVSGSGGLDLKLPGGK